MSGIGQQGYIAVLRGPMLRTAPGRRFVELERSR